MANAGIIPDNIEKLKDMQYQRFIDTTPSSTATWKILGIGISDSLSTEFNPQVDTEKWIIEDTSRSDHTSNQKQASVTQKCYKNDPVFEFVNAGRDKLNYSTNILEVDTWDGTTSGGTTTYPAKKTTAMITVTSYAGSEIGYDIYFQGDPQEGTVTIAGGVPTFTPSASV